MIVSVYVQSCAAANDTEGFLPLEWKIKMKENCSAFQVSQSTFLSSAAPSGLKQTYFVFLSTSQLTSSKTRSEQSHLSNFYNSDDATASNFSWKPTLWLVQPKARLMCVYSFRRANVIAKRNVQKQITTTALCYVPRKGVCVRDEKVNPEIWFINGWP